MNEKRTAVIYQIYPKSFYSANGQATGDIQGIIAKLDYLANLGVDYLWLTPIYPSPQRDNGYDVANYYDIDPRYGTLNDFKQLIAEAGERGMKIMMDIVVNHTSTDHPWFSEKPDYYIWRDEPNNWQSKFGGSAWQYDERRGQYYLHLFDVTQADLNWENEAMRHDVYAMMRFWADLGVGGFRLDVINLISKDERFLDDEHGDGRRYYTDGPRIHEFLQEMHREVFAHYDVLTVGEMSSTTLDHCVRYSRASERELDMTFSFHHLKVDYENGEKWTNPPFNFLALKQLMSTWQYGMNEGDGWNALFWCNHDQPRIVSRFGDDGVYRVKSAQMLATALHGLQGTPYIYQGEEIGMTNPHFTELAQYRDVETLNFAPLLGDDRLDIFAAKSRDNSRTPMQWNADGGFTSGTPWIDYGDNVETVNVANDLASDSSIYHYYRALIHLRKQLDVLTNGVYRQLDDEHPHLWVYERTTAAERLLVIANFYAETVEYELPVLGDIVLHNDTLTYGDGVLTVKPYEALMMLY